MRNNKWICFLVLITSVFLICSCGLSDKAQDPNREIILAAARDLSPGEKDPYFTSSILQVWEPLIALGEDGNPKPMLVTSWESQEAAKVWIFTLRENVTFHDGEPFNADAVVANFNRWKVMGYKTSPFYGTSLEKMYPNIVSWEAIAPNKIKLTFSKSTPTLPYLMASWNSAMFSPKCLNLENGDFKGLMQGTGPFKLKEVKKNQYTVIERNDLYWGEKAKAKQIKVRVIPNVETRFSALKSGEIMGVVDLGGLTPALANELLKDSKFGMDVNKMTITHYITVQGDKGPFKDERLKQAVSLAIDRDAIVKQYFYGYATPTLNQINSASPFGRVVKPIYNPEKAKALVKEVSGDQPIAVKFLIPQYGIDRYPYKEVSEWIQAELATIGIKVELQVVDGAAYKAITRDGNYDMSIHTRGLATMDPTKLLTEWMSNDDRGTINKESHIGYNNAEAQAIIDNLNNIEEMEARKEAYFKLQDIALEHPINIPLFEDQNLLVYNKKIKGFKPTIYGVTLSETEWVQ